MMVVSFVRTFLRAISLVVATKTLRFRRCCPWEVHAFQLPKRIQIRLSFHEVRTRNHRARLLSSTAGRRRRRSIVAELTSSPFSFPSLDIDSIGNGDSNSPSRAAPDKDRAVRLGQCGDLTYRTTKAAKAGLLLTDRRNKKPGSIVLIHPVGIGMASWFYDRLLEAWPKAAVSGRYDQNDREGLTSATLFAPNLRGCGRQDASLFHSVVDTVTLISFEGWVQDCAAFVDTVVMKESPLFTPPASFPFTFRPRKPNDNRCHLVVQGGLAPLGLELARRYPRTIRSLTLCSPPEVLRITPQADIEKNLRLLASPLGNAAIERLLENPIAIRLFSDLFLFASPCDPEWVRQASLECGHVVRRAVQFFNSGGCSRVTSADLPPLDQPVLILQGSADVRRRTAEYVASTSRVEVRTLQGAKNVLPWEASVETAAAIQDFICRIS